MKSELKFLFLANLALIVSILYYTSDLLTLIIDDTMQDAIPSPDIALNTTFSNNGNNMTDLIPKIIHQTYKTEDIPEHWKHGQQRCKDLHPDYQYILWTDEMAAQFIKEEFPWFYPTFKNYKYNIQRADSIRYFVLWKFGGIYMDLDDTCERKLDPLLKYPAFLRKTSPMGVSNDVMGTRAGHPFFLKVINSLKHYNKFWFVPYFTIMGSTGPLFISVVWKQYKRWEKIYAHNNFETYINSDKAVRVMQPSDYKLSPDAFFSISKGSSWHMDDADFIKSFLTHILSCVVAGFIFGFFILYFEYCIYCFICSKNNYTKNFIKWGQGIHQCLGMNNNNTDQYSALENSNTSTAPTPYSNQKFYKRLRKDSNNFTALLGAEKY